MKELVTTHQRELKVRQHQSDELIRNLRKESGKVDKQLRERNTDYTILLDEKKRVEDLLNEAQSKNRSYAKMEQDVLSREKQLSEELQEMKKVKQNLVNEVVILNHKIEETKHLQEASIAKKVDSAKQIQLMTIEDLKRRNKGVLTDLKLQHQKKVEQLNHKIMAMDKDKSEALIKMEGKRQVDIATSKQTITEYGTCNPRNAF